MHGRIAWSAHVHVTVQVASVGLAVNVSAWNGVQNLADAYYMSEIAYSFIGNSI